VRTTKSRCPTSGIGGKIRRRRALASVFRDDIGHRDTH
jgi:hypothetical protein